jgi:hypothetical protein
MMPNFSITFAYHSIVRTAHASLSLMSRERDSKVDPVSWDTELARMTKDAGPGDEYGSRPVDRTKPSPRNTGASSRSLSSS